MFINCKLFSHDRFVCTLISRGETFRNNLNDIKRPVQAIFMDNTNNPTSQPQHQPNQMASSHANTKLKQQQQFQAQKSVDYTSPMSVYQQPASMPPYNLPPHTPLQHQKSFSNDPSYNAPHSVPTPCKSGSISNILSQDDGQQQLLGKLVICLLFVIGLFFFFNKIIQQEESTRAMTIFQDRFNNRRRFDLLNSIRISRASRSARRNRRPGPCLN